MLESTLPESSKPLPAPPSLSSTALSPTGDAQSDLVQIFNAKNPIVGSVSEDFPFLDSTREPSPFNTQVTNLFADAFTLQIPVETFHNLQTGTEVNLAVEQVKQQLAEFLVSSDFAKVMHITFGNQFDTETVKTLLQDLTEGSSQHFPSIEIVPQAQLQGASGAFDSLNGKIYLAGEFVAQNTQNLDAIASVVLEEVGHAIDSKINTIDTPGDEGELFAKLVRGETLMPPEVLAIQAEDDTATLEIKDQFIAVELSTPTSFGINLNSVHYNRNGNKFVASNGTGGTYLWCTDFAFGRALEKGLIQNYTGLGGRISGNAGVWDDQSGSWGRQPRANSFVVWDPNQGGAGSVGHVGFVERVNADGSFTISEANFGSARMSFNSRTISPGTSAFNSAKFVYLGGTTPVPVAPTPPSNAFRGIVDAPLNIRSGPGTNFPIVGSLNGATSRNFDSVARGTTHWDAREQRNDNRWFRIQGTNQWVSAAFITGNPVFTGTVDAALNVRSGPGTNFGIVGSLSTSSPRQTFDATTVGTAHWDARERFTENRWFRIQGTDRWVSAAFITGNPTY
ncbi:MAG: CHAP domain-containing protein [Desertifilum sp. SIO1I2]|nr:CHAP domain-containing protein [Desertifilum sp. SIO1I2]